MVPTVFSEDMHRRIKGLRTGHLPRLRPWRRLPVPREVRPPRRRIPRPLTSIRTEGTKVEVNMSKSSKVEVNMSKLSSEPQVKVNKKAPHLVHPAVDAHRPAPPERDGPLEGPTLGNHLGHPRAGRSTARSTSPKPTPGTGPPPQVSRPGSLPTARSTASPKSPSPPRWHRCSGRAQTRLAYKDEINVFRRTLLYAGPPSSPRWYEVGAPGEKVGARALIYLRRRDGVSSRELPHGHQQAPGPRAHRHRGTQGTAHPVVHALEQEVVGHPERRA